ncbi:hypothetical protein ABZP36_024442 [Zizania latifolia]
MDYCGGVFDDEVTLQLSQRGGGQSKENLWVEVRAASAFAGKCSGGQEPMDLSLRKFQALGTPSAHPIAEDGNDAIFDTVAKLAVRHASPRKVRSLPQSSPPSSRRVAATSA